MGAFRLALALIAVAAVGLLVKIAIVINRLDHLQNLAGTGVRSARSEAKLRKPDAGAGANAPQPTAPAAPVKPVASEADRVLLIPKKIHQIWISRATANAIRPSKPLPSFIQTRVDKMHEINEATGWECRVWGNELWELYKDEKIVKVYRGQSESGQFNDLTIPFLAELFKVGVCVTVSALPGESAFYSVVRVSLTPSWPTSARRVASGEWRVPSGSGQRATNLPPFPARAFNFNFNPLSQAPHPAGLRRHLRGHRRHPGSGARAVAQ
jgi:hypothetical protein